MADKNKSEKLAAAKRKLKEFKSKQKTETNTTPTSIEIVQSAIPSEPKTNEIVHQHSEPEIDMPEPVPVMEAPTLPSVDLINLINNESLVNADENVTENIPNSEPMNIVTETKLIDLSVDNNSQPLLVTEPIQTITIETPVSNNVVNNNIADELVKANERNQEMCTQLWMQHSAMEQMRLEIDRLRQENENRNTLNKQLQSHVQSIEVLVSEKTELTNQLAQQQSLVKSKTDEMEELQARLFASRYRGQVLEKELDVVKSSQEKYGDSQQKLCTELENSRDDNKKLKKSLDDAEEEVGELKQKLNLKIKEAENRDTELEKVKFDLNISQLRVEQFSAGDQIEASNRIEMLLKEKNQFEQQAQELQQIVQQLNTERDVANQQYQNYVQHLSQESINLTSQVQSLSNDNERLTKREIELTKHVGDLEKQIQQQMAKRKSLSEVQRTEPKEDSEIVAKLNLRCEQLEMEKSAVETNLQELQRQVTVIGEQLQERTNVITELESTIEQIRSAQPDTKNLFATIESDKVAASRAVAQNQELKLQLEEIQNAYIQLSNDKLELTDKLQSEQHLGREIKIKSIDMEKEFNEIKEKLYYKDEEMMRLSHENEELNKEVLQHSQELDRLRHYEAKGHSAEQVHIQLLHANEQINRLRLRIKEYENQNNSANVNVIEKDRNESHEQDSNKKLSNENLELEKTDLNSGELEHPKTSETNEETDNHKYDSVSVPTGTDNSETMSISSTLNIATDQAMDRLQQRFTRTMSEVADLTEEKYRLEHLVMQLQGETETIGEYIALYQNQRRLLKQREFEKDIQLKQIAIEREEMKKNLSRLNNLVVQLLMQHGVENAKELVQSVQSQHKEQEPEKIEHPQVEHQEIMINGNLSPDDVNESLNIKKDGKDSQNTETATEIIKLLSEIKEKNLNPGYLGSNVSNVQHCHCCSGKLETV